MDQPTVDAFTSGGLTGFVSGLLALAGLLLLVVGAFLYARPLLLGGLIVGPAVLFLSPAARRAAAFGLTIASLVYLALTFALAYLVVTFVLPAAVLAHLVGRAGGEPILGAIAGVLAGLGLRLFRAGAREGVPARAAAAARGSRRLRP